MVALNVLIAGIAFADNQITNYYEKNNMSGACDRGGWFKGDIPNANIRERMVGGLDRWWARSLDFYTGHEFKLGEFLKARFGGRRLGKVGDYGCNDGFCGFLIAEALEAEKLVMMDVRNTPIDRVQRLIDNSDRIDYVPIEQESTFPENEKYFDLMMINDVLSFVRVDEVIPLLQTIENSLTENGLSVITITDNSAGQRDRLLQLYDKVKIECPELLNKFIFITYENVEQDGYPENRHYKVLTRGESSDLGDTLKAFIEHEDENNFITHSITEDEK
jgi:hypothetical protein